MAADSMLTMPPSPMPAAAASSPRDSQAPGAASAATTGPGSGGRSPAGADSTSQAPQSSAHESSGSGGSVGSNSTADSSGKSRAGGKPSGDSRDGRQAARAGGTSAAASSKSTAQAPQSGSDDFSAALAQSLAATPAPGAAAADGAAAKTSGGSGRDEPGARPAKHAAADPVSTALTLLEHALAGVLVGTPSPAPALTAAAPSTAAAGTISSHGGQSSAARSAAAALAAQLVADLPADAKTAASTAGASTAAAPAAAAGSVSAALTAAQLTAGPQVGAEQARPDPATLSLSSPVGSNAWTEELGTKVTWMAHQGIESASLQLSPAHLGPLQVSISVHNGQASVWFGAAQPDTRTALQQSLPQLRQLFASQGLTLSDAGVSREPPRGQDRKSPGRAPAPVTAVATVSLDGSAGRGAITGGLGLVDTYV